MIIFTFYISVREFFTTFHIVSSILTSKLKKKYIKNSFFQSFYILQKLNLIVLGFTFSEFKILFGDN